MNHYESDVNLNESLNRRHALQVDRGSFKYLHVYKHACAGLRPRSSSLIIFHWLIRLHFICDQTHLTALIKTQRAKSHVIR